MKKRQKWVSVLLTSTLLLSYAQTPLLSSVPYTVHAQNQNIKNQSLSNVSDTTFKDSDVITVIVKLKEEAVNSELLKTEEGRNQRKEQTLPLRQSVLNQLDALGIQYKKIFDYDLLFNGFSLELTYEQAKKVQSLPEVETVDVSMDYNAPTVNAVTLPNFPKGQAIDSNNIIDVQRLWDAGIKGQGQIVAIIDSGIDPNHDILHISDISQAKYTKESDLVAVKEKAGINYGKWYNDKLIFGFNYSDWDNNLMEEQEESHGMHVAGSAVGNPTTPAPNGDYVAGVAPEAQLMFMRVFSDKIHKGGTSSFIYVKAIEDAVKMGADTINMSLGSATGSVLEVGDTINNAIELAKQAGVSVVIAAGNSAVFGNGYAQPLATQPDYGLVGNPSVAYDSISVAALYNTAINQDVVVVKQLANNLSFNNGKGGIRTYETLFDPSIEYQYVYAGLGKPEDFSTIDVAGKVALIQRGEILFTEKIRNARDAGAIGVVIFNHSTGGEEILSLFLDGLDHDFPIVSMGHSFGEELSLHDQDYTLLFDGSKTKYVHEKANTLTNFTSWGLSSDGELKPDLTAPGGDIYSSFNNNAYGSISGTSMASPHVAGAVTLVKQALKQRFPDKTGAQLQALVKHLLMSNANVNVNKETNALTSPRQQGAGVIDVSKAATSDLYVTGTNDYGSISLGNIADEFVLNLIVHNLSNTDKTLNYTTYVNTDEVSEDGRMTLTPRLLFSQKSSVPISVPANGTATVQIPINVSSFASELNNLMPNGYYLEGFVKFNDAQTNLESISIPYVGFRGNFQDLAVLEKPIYDFQENEKPFYYYDNVSIPIEQRHRDEGNHFTSLVSSVQQKGKNVSAVLGEYVENGIIKFDRSKIAFSPNSDNQQDDISLKAVVLRNYENLNLSIYKKDDVTRQNPLYSKGNDQGTKTYFDNGQAEKSTVIDKTSWDGKDNSGNILPDGEYQYVVTYRPESSGGKPQEMSFVVRIDTVSPKVIDIDSQFNKETRRFTPNNIVEDGSGIYLKQLTYKKVDENGKKDENDTIIEPNEDGSYTIPENVAIDTVKFTLKDYAGNVTSLHLDGSIAKSESSQLDNDSNEEDDSELPDNQGSIEVKLTVDGEAFADALGALRYKITNDAGELVGDLISTDSRTYHTLPYGHYKVEIVLLDEEAELTSPKTMDVTLTPTNREQTVTFTANTIYKNKMTVQFDKLPPENTTVYAVNTKGEKVLLPQSKYNPFIFEKRIINGNYTFTVELPEGYSTNPTVPTYTVDNTLNKLSLTLVEPTYVTRVSTTSENNPIGEVTITTPVLNTTALVIDSLTNETDTALLSTQLKSILDIEPYNVTYYNSYFTRHNQIVTVSGTHTLTLNNFSKVDKIYQVHPNGSMTLVPHTSTNDTITFTLSHLGQFIILSEKEIVVPPVDKTDLQKEFNVSKDTVKENSYLYEETLARKTAFNDALENAQKVLNDEQARQEDVNNALIALQTARQALTGKAPALTVDESSSSTTTLKEETTSQNTSSQEDKKQPSVSNKSNIHLLDNTTTVNNSDSKTVGNSTKKETRTNTLPATGTSSLLGLIGSLFVISSIGLFKLLKKSVK